MKTGDCWPWILPSCERAPERWQQRSGGPPQEDDKRLPAVPNT